MANGFPLSGDGLASSELPTCIVLLSLHDLKLASPVPLIEVAAYPIAVLQGVLGEQTELRLRSLLLHWQ
jgi:hypothetical protein